MLEELIVGIAAIMAGVIIAIGMSKIGHSTLGLIFAIVCFGFGLWMLYRQAT